MKTLFAAFLLSTLAAPVLAMDTSVATLMIGTSAEVLFPTLDEFGRRSGHCLSRNTGAREGSTCGGV